MIITGEVIRGAQLGRKMGFPTANIDAQNIPDIENGVYFSRVNIDGVVYKAMSNIGYRPSVDGHTRLLETHIFDFSGDLYGQIIDVDLVRKIRDEQKFASIEALQQQLEADAARCKTEE
ncbi:MAG: riboflavin kinase [Alistipes sp.]|nr:riboflavin kinase [Alistipes sp.]